jgi:hypothetical protein
MLTESSRGGRGLHVVNSRLVCNPDQGSSSSGLVFAAACCPGFFNDIVVHY